MTLLPVQTTQAVDVIKKVDYSDRQEVVLDCIVILQQVVAESSADVLYWQLQNYSLTSKRRAISISNWSSFCADIHSRLQRNKLSLNVAVTTFIRISRVRWR